MISFVTMYHASTWWSSMCQCMCWRPNMGWCSNRRVSLPVNNYLVHTAYWGKLSWTLMHVDIVILGVLWPLVEDQTRQGRLGCFSKITLLAGEEKSGTSDQWPFTIVQNEYDETIRLLYCEAPPGIEQATYHTHPHEVLKGKCWSHIWDSDSRWGECSRTKRRRS